jgi:DNA-binding IclR family transcriptional regulator
MTLKNEGTQSIARAALLLRTLSTFESMGASLMQISTLTQLPKATVHRILAAMTEERLVERPPGSRHYRLGPDVYALGVPMRGAFDLKTLAHPSLERLASGTGATAYLGVRSGYDMLCLDKADTEPPQPSLLLEVHDRWPLGIGSFGLALLSFLSPVDIEEVIAFNQRRVSEDETLTFKHIQKSIQKTRRNGYAKRSTRSYKGLAGVAAPVFDDRRYPIASLCVVAEANLMTAAKLASLAEKLKREAALITKLYEGVCLQQQQQQRWRLAVRGSATTHIPE